MTAARAWRIFCRWTPVAARYLCAWLHLHLFRRDLLRRDIWLIAEKRTEARDNGYHLFRYLREQHPEVEAYYVITPDSPDRPRVEPLGRVITADSREHFLCYLAATCSISSQAGGAFPMQMIPEFFHLARPLRRAGQKCVFLQHGVTYNAVPMRALHAASRMHDLFVTASEWERAFVQHTFGYPDGVVQTLGLCRFDALQPTEEPERLILFMPTWREWLCAGQTSEPFCESDYFMRISALLQSPRLRDLLERFDYRLVFYPHYALQGHIDVFRPLAAERIVIADHASCDVQALLLRSAVLLTDYSSVFFDFAYLQKPEIFYQFDAARFHREHYPKGTFDFTRDAFGPVAATETETLDALERVLESRCVLAEEYRARVSGFFAYHDGQNCARNYEAIRNLVSQ